MGRLWAHHLRKFFTGARHWSRLVVVLIAGLISVRAAQAGVDRLLKIGIYTDLECFFHRWQPAQTHIVFDYTPFELLDYTQPHNSGYLILGIP